MQYVFVQVKLRHYVCGTLYKALTWILYFALYKYYWMSGYNELLLHLTHINFKTLWNYGQHKWALLKLS